MEMQFIQLVFGIVGILILVAYAVYLYVSTFVWSETKIGKLQSENECLKKKLVAEKLENDLLKREKQQLIDMVYDLPEASADEEVESLIARANYLSIRR